MRWLAVAFVLLLAHPALAAEQLDTQPRTAVVSAYEPEWPQLLAATTEQKRHSVNGVEFVTGVMEGKPVVLFLSGVSMVNAAMTTQLALDRFAIERIVFSGIAGGVDPALDIGDVVVADKWGQYLDGAFRREGPQGFPAPATGDFANHGMIFPGPVVVRREGQAMERRFWFEADPGLLSLARQIAAQPELKRCAPSGVCLAKQPRIVVGGAGVSGPVFVDNAAFRQYVDKTFQAKVLDMETAAVAHVAYANKVPFIAFRSLSDLAGGGDGPNEIRTFMALASENSATVVRAFVKALP
jgi:adenosylhomocysteine nucleosidase